MYRTELMRKLWEKAEGSEDFRTKKLLEIAGNLVEATFTTDDLSVAVSHALKDSDFLVTSKDKTNFLMAMEIVDI